MYVDTTRPYFQVIYKVTGNSSYPCLHDMSDIPETDGQYAILSLAGSQNLCQTIKESDIAYHMTKHCYKGYVHIKALSKGIRKRGDNDSDEMETENVTQEKKRTRQSTSPSTSGPITGLSQKEIDYLKKMHNM